MSKFPADFGPLEYNADNKARFLRAGSALLKSAAKELVSKGVAETSVISVNRAGIAVSGDVYGYVYAPGLRHGVLITLTGGSFSGNRSDRLVCYLQYRTINGSSVHHCGKLPPPSLPRIVGNNVYVDNIDTGPIIQTVERMLVHFPATSSVA
ncbi:conserved protein of unknown function [Acidithiobacillus ferrivorans]|uniref:Uncharacterized protein n=1 Tax=Acidithiobacillus ferrivorans TaxID=160808 RepID=A0A060UL47_9PROT|nr:hypothetical protein [Acidithiobacillus ferrivorans]CDQ09210.1 conserved hypothetical protein [Acidithiobacillus ferrivorans]SMH64877.1 conserved protein of unknown function [Acidithiobacillus ferrivorans]